MRLLIKQRVFSWTDTYDVYDGQEQAKYYVKADFFTLGHQIHVYDKNGKQLGGIYEKLLTFLPAFEVKVGEDRVGTVQKKLSFLIPRYELSYKGWQVEGDILGWEYDVRKDGQMVAHIHKEWLSWGDTYVIEFDKPEDELYCLLLVIAIDAANCGKG